MNPPNANSSPEDSDPDSEGSLTVSILVSKNGEIRSIDSGIIKRLGYESFHRLTGADLFEHWDLFRNRTFPWNGTVFLLDPRKVGIPFAASAELLSEELILIHFSDPQVTQRLEEQFFQIFHKNLAIKLIIDVETGRLVNVSDSALEFYGYSREEFLKLKINDVNILDPEEVKAEMLKASSENRLYFNFIHRLKSGELRDVEVFSGPISINGRIHLYSIIHDVTERNLTQKRMQESLKEKELMLQEIHHRVKNNLQIVSSLLSLHSEFKEDPYLQKVLRECELRVKSMALVHEELYRSDNLAKVDLKSYCFSLSSNLLSVYGQAGKIRFHNLENSFFISIDRAIPIGLILNELLTNSLKYAFGDQERGEIFLDLKNADGCVELEYRDTGTGFNLNQAQNKQSGLGLKLIDMLSMQLHAKLFFQAENGFFLRMHFSGWKD
ncbi:hypothetical protein DLM76_13180 [Leptospira yasudae]|uniref:sensor histidine kinase n=1 Tax=Leptospira yasudae TaxID=2202201 RepID=UPI000E59BD02|nr:histidine kinase dimerization/phosphoacceptor domain -containing protein [Leptospira yasudae]RHX93931.1 hypothetical protein DLM76_13180 [Leptospira yasudae]